MVLSITGDVVSPTVKLKLVAVKALFIASRASPAGTSVGGRVMVTVLESGSGLGSRLAVAKEILH